MNIKDRLRYFTAKYRVIEVKDKFGGTTYVAQVRKYLHWEPIKIKVHFLNQLNYGKIELREYYGRDNVTSEYKYALMIIDNYILAINSLVKPKTIIKYV